MRMFHALLFCILFVLMVTSAQQKRGVTNQSYGPRQQKPNIILILTDDQDVELGSLNYMPKTLKAIKYQGAEFRHAYVTTPMCCPSRSSLLTGMYVHNHNVFTNNDNCSSTTWQTTHETRSFATYLSNAGYRTGYFGKYLNKYNGSYIPPGWREWGGLIMNSKYYNYSINMNGKKIKHGFDYSKDYYPDLIANDSIAFLRQSKKNSVHKPVMLTMSFPAPHGPEDSAPQYSDLFFNVTSHHIPSYNYAPNPDKQWILQVTKKMQPIHKQFTDLLMTKRLQTLQSVDAAVQRVVEELSNLGELQNTYIIYTSDHGYHLGQFGLIKGKSFPFEFDVRVPFLVRGPGIEPGAVIDEIVLNIDLAPTFLDIAGVETPTHMDGRSILPLISSGNRRRLKWPDTFLIESSGRRENPHLEARLRKNSHLSIATSSIPTFSSILENTTFSMIEESGETTESSIITTTPNKIYESEEELEEEDENDDDSDSNLESQKLRELETEIQEEEITNQDSPPLKREQMQLDNRVLPGFIPLYSKLERLVKECSQPNMQKPCVPNQKWYCEYDNGRWRKHKCKSLVPNPHLSERYRKCACFTPRGMVYKKIPIEMIQKKTNVRTRKRNRRRSGFTNFVSMKIGMNKKESLRIKRETIEEVDNVMSTIKGQLNELQFVNTSLVEEQLRSKNLETNLIGNTISGCKILSRGNVNCSNQVYNNRRVWQKSRHEVNNEIHELKDKLEQLKEIRRHLKHYRPQYNPETSGNDSMEIQFTHHSRFNRKKHHRKGEIKRAQKPLKSKINENSTERNLENLTSTTTTNPTTVSSSTTETNKRKNKHQKIQNLFTTERKNPDEIPYPINNCICEISETDSPSINPNISPNKKKIDEEKMRRKARRQRKKESLDKQCSSEKMNCFHHDNDHWKTVPLWTNGPFCFCMNSNNNTYSCVRTINVTHNFLYCEFTTGLITFYNLRIDPFELQNRFDQLKPEEKLFLHEQLKELVSCKGRSCTVNQSIMSSKIRNNVSHKPMMNNNTKFHRYKKKQITKSDEVQSGEIDDKRFSRLMLRNNSKHNIDRKLSFVTTRRKRKSQREIRY